ncbi:GGDEF domain-containing protein [Edaphobacter albus]|uniref:GGDEF domain-containing protein n=1 Tax=Edaphobacter sp. 4G125 TaxID=2763071 RepID=UPI001646329F|nr:GGDEF domain-containing protein [Edaphobacter sp. 4G125]QNI36973.1 GGDEF domain-containing protein [Edaphobacter sp. 4G125]
MDYTTSHISFLVSVGLFTIALFALSLADRCVIGARWFAASTLIEFIKTALQGLNGHIPRLYTVCLANELNVLAFFAMFLGFRWFVVRRPFRAWGWLIPMAATMAVYPFMFLLKMRNWSFSVIGLPVLGICLATILVLWRQKNERFAIPARLTAFLVGINFVMLLYRCVLSIRENSAVGITTPWQDPRWMYSMLVILFVAYCLLLMYTLFTVLEMHANVTHVAGVDALTGALNRRMLMKYASRKFDLSLQTERPLAAIAVDLDNFKRVNDTYGHGGGDVALCAFVELVKETLRPDDVIARTGGEEFVLVLPGMDRDSAAALAENLRYSLEQMRIHYDGRLITMTTSAGVTERRPEDSLAAMLERADRLLYRAKAHGRNCVVTDDHLAQHPKPILVERLRGSRSQSGKMA